MWLETWFGYKGSCERPEGPPKKPLGTTTFEATWDFGVGGAYGRVGDTWIQEDEARDMWTQEDNPSLANEVSPIVDRDGLAFY